MTVISKAELAAELGISRARVSQYCKRGLPQRSDGKLDRVEALEWITENCLDQHHSRDAGVNRAREFLAKPPVNPPVRSTHCTALATRTRVPPPLGFEWVERMKTPFDQG